MMNTGTAAAPFGPFAAAAAIEDAKALASARRRMAAAANVMRYDADEAEVAAATIRFNAALADVRALTAA